MHILLNIVMNMNDILIISAKYHHTMNTTDHLHVIMRLLGAKGYNCEYNATDSHFVCNTILVPEALWGSNTDGFHIHIHIRILILR